MKERRTRRRTRDRIANDPMPKIVPLDPPRKGKINPDIVARSKGKPTPVENAFVLPQFPPKALPPGMTATKHPLAMDAQVIEVNAWAAQSLYAGAFNNGATFLGYPYLSQLAQIPEYRKITETIAMHMTRKFITLQAVGEAGEGDRSKTDKIKQLNDDIENFGLRDVFRKAAEVDGYFGRAHLYIDLGYADRTELRMPIGDGSGELSKLKVTKDKLKGFKIIEPVWTYPGNYNSNNPMTMDWYNPQTWFVMQQEIHVSRCIRMVGREVPDLLKPAYSFGGLSLSQMAKPYIDNWLRTRQSVADLIWSFSVSGVSTDLQTLMQADGGALFDRAELFNNLRNNRGMMLLNKDTEEFFQVNTPLGTLDKLQAQAQEHMASVSSIPLVFLLGITPSGLNASSEGEIRAFYDFIHAYQMKFFTDPLKRCIDFIQLNRYGEIDPDITFIYEPLWSSTEKEQSEIDKTNAETDDVRINSGVISPLEARKRVANAPDSPYAGLDVTVLPVPPGGGEGEGGEDPFGGDDPDSPDGPPDPDAPDADFHEENPIPGHNPRDDGEDDNPFAEDSAFNEGDHPRGQPNNAGQFGPGGGGSGGSEKAAKTETAATGGRSASVGVMTKGEGYKTVSTIREYFDVMKQADAQLDDKEKAALNHYTSPAYAPINKALRGDKKLSPETQEIVDTLDKAIGKTHLPEAMTLYRGLRGKQVREMLDGLMPGDTLTDKGFVSTSMSNRVSKDQSAGKRSTMVIRAPKGANAALPGESSYNQSTLTSGEKYDNAFEAVLPRGSQFKFVGKKGATFEFELVSPKGAQDEWVESKHPRGQPGNAGQFGPGGGGSNSPSAQAAVKAVNAILGKTAGISGKYRQGIQALLKDPFVTIAMKTKLKQKLVESYFAKAAQLKKNGDPKADAVHQKGLKIAKTIVGQMPQPVPTPTNIPINTPAPISAAPKPGGKATPQELEKAKKSVKLQLQYVPGAPQGNATAQHLVDQFNKKWEGQNNLPQHLLEEKVDDFKQLAENMKPLQSEAQKQQAAAAEKQKLEAQEKAKKEAEELAKQMNDPEVAKHIAALKAVGAHMSPEKKKYMDATIKKAGLEGVINAVDCAAIQAYTGAHYGAVNEQMRAGTMTPEQFGYAKTLQQALLKLPNFKGTVKRGTNLPPEVFKKYKPGYIVPERAFTSTGEGYKFNGSHTYEIEAIAGKDVRHISSQGSGEQEVIFPAGSHFEVISVTGNHIKMRQVESL